MKSRRYKLRLIRRRMSRRYLKGRWTERLARKLTWRRTNRPLGRWIMASVLSLIRQKTLLLFLLLLRSWEVVPGRVPFGRLHGRTEENRWRSCHSIGKFVLWPSHSQSSKNHCSPTLICEASGQCKFPEDPQQILVVLTPSPVCTPTGTRPLLLLT